MKRVIILFGVFLFGITSYAEEKEPEQLYARSAVLMDADSGRVLFEKNGYEKHAMASTTKIMTCILALEEADVDAVVTASEYAERQPRVHLGMKKDEQFYLKDLLYSLMLESHNDSAVAIAEHIGGSVEHFAELMNQKAREIGCKDTYFITPNGLDAFDEHGIHGTTAEELAKIMRYCIRISPQKSLFLKITQAPKYEFSNIDGNRRFSCYNHNAFLQMMEGALSGKTGFTGDAGYCYVGALERDGRTFIVALLGCGWPNHKGYKWVDTKKLMEYGIQNYEYRDVFEMRRFPNIEVENGIPENDRLFEKAVVKPELRAPDEEKTIPLLLRDGEAPDIKVELKQELQAPVRQGEKVGTVSYYLNGVLVKKYCVSAVQTVQEKSISWCFKKLLENYMLK